MPYATAVLIDDFKESETITRIHSTIVVEKESQKPIVIGAGGHRIKEIGTAARVELERLFPPKVFLELFVKVQPNWRDDQAIVSELDYRAEGSRQ
jgi:GTP-binding protein Era